MAKESSTGMQEFEHEIINLRARLEETEGTLRAIHSGEVDALVIATGQGEQIFTLRGADHTFRVLIENMSEGALTITTEGLILYANQRLAQMLRRPLEKVLGSSLLDWISPADWDMLQALLVKDNGRRRLAWLTLVDGDSGLVPAQLSLTNLQLDGVPENICVVVTDLTEQKEQEKALQESEARYRSLVENATEGIVVIQDNIIKYANPTAEKLLACPAVEIISTPFSEFVHPDDRHIILERQGKRMKGHEPENPFNFRLAARDGRIRYISQNSDTIKWGGDPAILALMTDITEVKKMEEEMLRADKLDSLGILAGGIAHDFNNYLATLLANISLAKLYKNDLAKIEEKMENMEKATLRAKDLSNKLFTFSQGGAPHKEKISVSRLIMDNIKFALSGTEADPRFYIKEDLSMLEADGGQLSQVLNNLAINAVQAMPEGGTLEVRAENIDLPTDAGKSALPLPDGPYIKVTIRDEGTGIPEKYLKKIFDPFFTTKDKGRGLGLASSYSIIKKHGGHISVDSQAGVGTCFAIFLPALDTAEQTQPDGEAVLQGSGKILIMDDEEDLLTAAGEGLSALGYDVTLSRDGGQAMAHYTRALEQNEPFHLVILDLTIPGGMGGKRTMEELLKLDPEVKAIVVSGYSNDPVMAAYRNFGFKGKVMKPFTMEELSKTVKEVVG